MSMRKAVVDHVAFQILSPHTKNPNDAEIAGALADAELAVGAVLFRLSDPDAETLLVGTDIVGAEGAKASMDWDAAGVTARKVFRAMLFEALKPPTA